MWRDIEVEGEWLGVELGDNSTIFDGESEVHEVDALTPVSEGPGKTSSVHQSLELVPSSGVFNRVGVV